MLLGRRDQVRGCKNVGFGGAAQIGRILGSGDDGGGMHDGVEPVRSAKQLRDAGCIRQIGLPDRDPGLLQGRHPRLVRMPKARDRMAGSSELPRDMGTDEAAGACNEHVHLADLAPQFGDERATDPLDIGWR